MKKLVLVLALILGAGFTVGADKVEAQGSGGGCGQFCAPTGYSQWVSDPVLYAWRLCIQGYVGNWPRCYGFVSPGCGTLPGIALPSDVVEELRAFEGEIPGFCAESAEYVAQEALHGFAAVDALVPLYVAGSVAEKRFWNPMWAAGHPMDSVVAVPRR